MRKLIYISFVAALLAGCVNLGSTDPYKDSLNNLTVNIVYGDDLSDYIRAGISISITERNQNYSFSAQTDDNGQATLELPNGSYRIVVSDNVDGDVYNASADQVILSGSDREILLYMTYAKAGELVIKEAYFGGCTMYPEDGNYRFDSYVIIHNNTSEIQYLDSLCFGTLDPYNSTGTNVWVSTDSETGETIFRDYVPVIQAVWQFPGSGTDFPLEPGEDAVLCIYGAIDHTQQYPNSVNLNNSEYFVCYNNTYFPNTSYHPAPGSNIQQDHILNVVIKTGQANAYTFSITSPAIVLFKAPSGTTIQEFVADSDNVIQKPGSSVDRIVAVPLDWVIDGVEVFAAGGNNKKRVPTDIDAGNIEFSGSFQGHTIMRYVDEDATETLGYEVLTDTNNSGEDFYETEIQSLHE